MAEFLIGGITRADVDQDVGLNRPPYPTGHAAFLRPQDVLARLAGDATELVQSHR